MAVKIQTIKDIRFYLAKELNHLYDAAEIRILSDILIKSVSGITKLYDLYDPEFVLREVDAEKIIYYVSELKTGKPVQYVVGETVFYNCVIKVNSSTLIPRPETEELVDLVIKENKGYSGKILDLGTGSGCIAIALALNLPLAMVTGSDISEEALSVARENSILNKAGVSFLNDDIFNISSNQLIEAGIFVSNPPYVRNIEMKDMGKNVVDFEPHNALFVSDSEPLIFYEAILRRAEKALLPKGRVYFEINESMGNNLVRLMEEFNYSEIQVVRDIHNKDRILKGRKNG